MRFKNETRKALMLVGGVAGALLLSMGTVVPANAEVVGDDPPISAHAQDQYDQEVGRFVAEHPEPTAVDSSASVDEQNAYQAAMAAWWETVPWDAVAGQWGCQIGDTNVTLSEPDENGLMTAGNGGVMQCDSLTDAELSVVALPESRSSAEARRGVLATYCDFIGGTEDYCLSSSGSTMTASFQWQGTGNKTGRARLGNVGLGGACGLGTQIALGALGTGSSGAVWYASGTVNQNSKWSSSFLIGTANYGSWCATI